MPQHGLKPSELEKTYGPAASVYDTVDNGPVRQSSKLHPAQLAEDYGFAPLPMLPPVANRKEKPATAASPNEDASEAPFDALRGEIDGDFLVGQLGVQGGGNSTRSELRHEPKDPYAKLTKDNAAYSQNDAKTTTDANRPNDAVQPLVYTAPSEGGTVYYIDGHTGEVGPKNNPRRRNDMDFFSQEGTSGPDGFVHPQNTGRQDHAHPGHRQAGKRSSSQGCCSCS